MLSNQLTTENHLRTDAAVQLREVSVWTYKRDEIIAQGIAPCVRPGMIVHDTERNQYGTAKLCTANAVSYTTPDGKEFTVAYNDISLQAAGPDPSACNSEDNEASAIDAIAAFDGQYPETRGALMHDGGKLAGVDTRFGVPVPIGALVWANEVEGVLVDATDQLAIIRDEKGLQHAERWGAVQVQASGPARTNRSLREGVPAPREEGLIQLDDKQLGQLDRDPYRRAALRALDLLAFIDHLQVEVGSLENDRNRAIEMLSEIEMKLSDIADNRARRIIESGASE